MLQSPPEFTRKEEIGGVLRRPYYDDMNSFRITGLSPQPFQDLFGLSDRALSTLGAKRYIAHQKPGFPDRVELNDSEVGQTLLLVNFVHQPAETPYRASHAIFIREGATSAYDRIDAVPEALRVRPLSLRAFDKDHMLVDADLVDGREVETLIERLLKNSEVSYVQAHFAKRGCYAARIERA